MSDAVTLEFLAAQQRQLLDEMSLFRAKFAIVQDDVRVLSAMAVRQDTTSKAVFDQLERGNEAIRRVSEEMHRLNDEIQRVNGEIQRVNGEMQRVNGEMQRVNERLTSIEARIQ